MANNLATAAKGLKLAKMTETAHAYQGPVSDDDEHLLYQDLEADSPYQLSSDPQTGDALELTDIVMLGYEPDWGQQRMGLTRRALQGLALQPYLDDLSPLVRHALQPLCQHLSLIFDPSAGQPAPLSGPQAWGSASQPYWRPGPNPAADMIVQKGNSVLLIQRGPDGASPGQWALPGGFHETAAALGQPWRPGLESAAEAALREVQEETGLDASLLSEHLSYLGFFDSRGRDSRDNDYAWAVSNTFMARLPEGAPSGVAGADDAADAAWIELSELASIELAFDHRLMLQKAGLL